MNFVFLQHCFIELNNCTYLILVALFFYLFAAKLSNLVLMKSVQTYLKMTKKCDFDRLLFSVISFLLFRQTKNQSSEYQKVFVKNY